MSNRPYAFRPQTYETLRGRYAAALAKVHPYNVEAPSLPGEENYFDFEDGLRVSVTREAGTPVGPILHIAASTTPGSPLGIYLDGLIREGRVDDACDSFMRHAELAFREISGEIRPLVFLGFNPMKGYPEWYVLESCEATPHRARLVATSDDDSKYTLLPPEPGVCPVCAHGHPAEEGHNAGSVYYQYRFYGNHGRWPTWADAVAHCEPEARRRWEEAIRREGQWSEPDDGRPIAEPPAESILCTVEVPAHAVPGNPNTPVFAFGVAIRMAPE